MKTNITEEHVVALLDLLKKEIITENQFYEIIKLDEDKVKYIISILNLEGIEEVDELIEKLKVCDEIVNVYFSLEENPSLRKSGAKRDFIIKNSKYHHIDDFAKLIVYDFIFEDKELLDILLSANRTKEYVWDLGRSIDALKENIENNPEFYKDGSKNLYIRQAFQITTKNSLGCQSEFIDLIEDAEVLNNSKWYSYIKECCNLDNLLSEFSLNYLCYRLRDKMEERSEGFNQKLEEIDNRKLKKQEKLKLFYTFLERLVALDDKILEKDNYFNYMMKHILDKKEIYEQHRSYVELFQDEDSICKEETEFYQVLFSKFYDIKGGKHLAIKRYLILRALRTSLAKSIDLDFVKTHKTSSYKKLKTTLMNLAIEHEANDYLERYHSDYLREKEKSPSFKQLVQSTNNNSKLTKEELLKLRDSLQIEVTEQQEEQRAKQKYKRL